MNRRFYIVAPLIIIMLLTSCLGGCSKSTIEVEINDMMTKTIVTITSGATVAQAIEEAELQLGEKDEVSPKSDTQLNSGDVITISRYADATVEYNGRVETVSLVGATVAQAIEQSGIKPDKSYAVNYDENAFLTDGMQIVITKLINITLKVDGKTLSIATPSCTVAELIENQGIVLSGEDTVSPSLNTKLTADRTVVIKRVQTKTITEKEIIEFNTVYKTSASMKQGTSKVMQEGRNGEKKVKYKVVYIDGKEASRETIEETVITKPVDKIVMQGAQETTTKNNGKTIVSKQRVDDCDGSGHGYFVITWSDGSVTYEEY